MIDRNAQIEEVKQEIDRITHRLDHELDAWEGEYLRLDEARDDLQARLRILLSGGEPPPEESRSFLGEAHRIADSVRGRRHAEREAKEKAKWGRVSSQLEAFARRLRSEIMADARGGASLFGDPAGSVRLELVDEEGAPILFMITEGRKIQATSGFRLLQAECAEVGAQLDLEDDAADLEMNIHRLHDMAPTLCHFTLGVSGW